jgi:hypothetical protein
LDPALGEYTLNRFCGSVVEMKKALPRKQEAPALKGDRDSYRPSMSSGHSASNLGPALCSDGAASIDRPFAVTEGLSRPAAIFLVGDFFRLNL